MIQGQSKFQSFIEANTNTFVGFFLNLLVSPTIYRVVGMEYTYGQLWIVTGIFTVVSIVRGYIIRRWFNKKEKQQDLQLELQIRELKASLGRANANYFTMQSLANDYIIKGDFYKKRNKKLEEEIVAAKHNFQTFIADAVENGHLLEEPIHSSIKREIENEQ